MYMKSLIAVLVMLSGAVDALAQTDTITGRVHQLEEVTVTEKLRKHTISKLVTITSVRPSGHADDGGDGYC